MAFKIVPNPGRSFIGIHNKRTITLTRNVVCPNVQFICSEIPWANTVQGATPSPAATVIASPVPKIHKPEVYILQIIQVLIGTIFVGIGSGLYLTANLGPGPRDGWMTGIQRITNIPIARVRATIEMTVLLLGYYLGGTLGLGTIIFALLIGHVVAISLQLTGRFGTN